MKKTYLATLKNDLVLTQNASTAGSHNTLDYLPKNTLLGVMANRLYPKIEHSLADTWFQKGGLTISDGYPLVDDEIYFPVPASLHYLKNDSPSVENTYQLNKSKLFDPSITKKDGQPKPLRTGYISESGKWIHPTLDRITKTAIDADTGRAAESQLYSYQFLKAGSRYLFSIEADVDDTQAAQINHSIEGKARIGRSRRAEFGGVIIEQTDKVFPSFAESLSHSSSAAICIWLTTDMALRDDFGQASLIPKAAHFNLPDDFSWDASSSFLRHRLVSRYNGYRRCYDSDQLVVSAGSVLRFNSNASLSGASLSKEQLDSIKTVGAKGARFIVGDPINYDFKETLISKTDKQVIKGSETPLIKLLKIRAGIKVGSNENSTQVEKLFKELCSALTTSRAYQGIPDKVAFVLFPSKSQWGSIRDMASKAPVDQSSLYQQIEHLIEGRNGWLLPLPDQNLGDFLLNKLKKVEAEKDSHNFALFVKELCVKVGSDPKWAQIIEGSVRSDAKQASGGASK